MRQTLKIAVMVLVVAALAATGVALAQSDDGVSVFDNGNDQTAPLPTAPDDEVSGLGGASFSSRILEWLAPLVDDGTITQDQAQAVADTLGERMPGPGAFARGVIALHETADFLGITEAELIQAVRDGSTLADIAVANGHSAEELIDHLVGLMSERLDQAVAAGRLTEDQAAAQLDTAREHITAAVNGEIDGPLGGMGPGFGVGPGFGRHMGNGPCTDTDDSDEMADLGA